MKYDFLYEKIPSLKNAINFKKLSFMQKLCLENIYIHYFLNKEMDKSKIRKSLLEKRESLDLKKIKKKSYKLNKKVLKLKEYQKAKVVFCYISFGSEIDTYLIMDDAFNYKKLAVPIIKNGIMIPSLFTDYNVLKKNKYGIYEPQKIIPVKKNDIDITIVPAIAYNPLGFRLGYGAGFYDMFLKDYKGFSIGMIMKEFLSNDIIPQYYDIAVNKVIIL